jgi:parvulin-like peptidyl-prolyl isomerase
LNLQEIILSDKQIADSILYELKNGSDFGKLAQENSLRKWTAEQEGEIGFAPISKFGMLKDTLWNSLQGEIIGPIKIQGYYGIFKVLGKSDSKPIEFEKVKSEVIGAYKREHDKELVKKYLENLYGSIPIKINRQLLGSINIAG